MHKHILQHDSFSNPAKCDFCNAEEGQGRQISLFLIKLEKVTVFNTEKKACQSCAGKYNKMVNDREKYYLIYISDRRFLQLKKFVSRIFISKDPTFL